jgi:superfamily II RNA helicase
MTAEIVARLGWSFEEERRSSEGAASFREYANRDALTQAEAAIDALEKELAELKAKIIATKSKFAASRLLKL